MIIIIIIIYPTKQLHDKKLSAFKTHIFSLVLTYKIFIEIKFQYNTKRNKKLKLLDFVVIDRNFLESDKFLFKTRPGFGSAYETNPSTGFTTNILDTSMLLLFNMKMFQVTFRRN